MNRSLMLLVCIGGCTQSPVSRNEAPIGDTRPALIQCALGDGASFGTATLSCTSAAPPAPLAYTDATVETVDAQGNTHNLAMMAPGVAATQAFPTSELPLKVIAAELVSTTGDNGDGFDGLGIIGDYDPHPLASGDTYTLPLPFDVWTVSLGSDTLRVTWSAYDLSIAPLSNGFGPTVHVNASAVVQPGGAATLRLPVAPGTTSLPVRWVDASCGSGKMAAPDGSCVPCGADGQPACPSGSVDGSGSWQIVGNTWQVAAPPSSSGDSSPSPAPTGPDCWTGDPSPMPIPCSDPSPAPSPSCGTDGCQ